MRKEQKRLVEEFLTLLMTAQEHIMNLLDQQEYASVLALLQQCQQGAIQMGTVIEDTEGENCSTIGILEEYCELVFSLFQSVNSESESYCPDEAGVMAAQLEKLLEAVAVSIEDDLPVRKQIVFLPYKASMWDSLESIWKAAEADEAFDVHVVPIPYYDKNPDGSFKKEYYEGEKLPPYVKIKDYKVFPLEEMRPDVIYIHTPYDHCNYVTSIHPRFYSYELKNHTDMLVYVPYFASSGNMSEGQALCSAYQHVDYMVLQAEGYEQYIDASIPREKILTLGSPKFDRVIHLNQSAGEYPSEWVEKAKGKKVYFYNTSISGMLSDTRSFLMKMEYVFRCFAQESSACLLWRPHPLLESTFDSMRKEYRPFYDRLKKIFEEKELGIYDDTPDMEKSIAFSDAYVGDAGSSVISMFGIVGKPIFILNNSIHGLPGKEDWRGQILKPFFADGNDRWRIVQGNKVYVSEKDDYHYRYYCDLSEFAYGMYYHRVVEANGKAYVCPRSAQDILRIENGRIVKRIALKKRLHRQGAFEGSVKAGRYIFLMPNKYPSLVRLDTKTDSVEYIDGFEDVFVRNLEGQICTGGSCLWKDYLLMALPSGNRVIAIHTESLKVQQLTTGTSFEGGCTEMIPEKDCIWMLPAQGKTIVRWNPDTGEATEYSDVPEGFVCRQKPMGFECDAKPYSGVAFIDDKLILSPCWGNMFVELDKRTGKTEKWMDLSELGSCDENGYTISFSEGRFLREIEPENYLYYNEKGRRLCAIQLRTKEWKEIGIHYDMDELRLHEAGFAECSQWLRYCAIENVFNTLPGFLRGEMYGNAFDSENQIRSFQKVSSDTEGKAGEKIHTYIRGKVL